MFACAAASPPVRRLFATAIAAVVASGLAVAACDGTTGREGLAVPAVPAVPEAGADATATYDAALFDVVLTYADRALPDVGAPVEAGEAGYPWPSCPPFINVGPDGQPVEAGQEVDQIPSTYGPGGLLVAAPDGSACATFGWLGSLAVDRCMTSSSAGGLGADDYAFLPPCNWSAEAGAARQGSRAGSPRYDVCLDLYACIMKSGCGAAGVTTCLCGAGPTTACDAGGPCGAQELAALEYRVDSIQDALKNFTNVDPAFSGYGGSALNNVFQNATSNNCFDAGAP